MIKNEALGSARLDASIRLPKQTPGVRNAGFLWAGVSLLIFSGWFVVTRFSVTRELAVWDIIALRFGVGAVLLAPAVLGRERKLPWSLWRKGFLLMILWGAPFVFAVALGLKLTSAAQAASITPTLMPVFAGVFARVFLGQRPGWVRLGGYVAIVAGLVFLVAAGMSGHTAPNPLGIVALVVAAALWAAYTLVFRASGLTAIQSAAMICVWSTATFLPVYALFGLGRFRFASIEEIALQAIYQGLLMSGVALITFNRAISLLGASAATAIIAFLPAVAALLAIPILREVPSALESLAIVVIVAGALCAARPAHVPSKSVP